MSSGDEVKKYGGLPTNVLPAQHGQVERKSEMDSEHERETQSSVEVLAIAAARKSAEALDMVQCFAKTQKEGTVSILTGYAYCVALNQDCKHAVTPERMAAAWLHIIHASTMAYQLLEPNLRRSVALLCERTNVSRETISQAKTNA